MVMPVTKSKKVIWARNFFTNKPEKNNQQDKYNYRM